MEFWVQLQEVSFYCLFLFLEMVVSIRDANHQSHRYSFHCWQTWREKRNRIPTTLENLMQASRLCHTSSLECPGVPQDTSWGSREELSYRSWHRFGHSIATITPSSSKLFKQFIFPKSILSRYKIREKNNQAKLFLRKPHFCPYSRQFINDYTI